MSKVQVQKHEEAVTPIWSLFEDMEKQFEQIQKRAFSLFQERGGEEGMDLDDWFRAEREHFEIPPSELTEDEKEIHVRAATPGLKAEDLQVTVTPHELAIKGETSTRDEKKKGKRHFSELTERKVFRRYALPAEVDVEKVTAKLDDGMLLIDMPKVKTAEKTKKVEAGKDA